MAKTAITVSPRIVYGGGPITSDVYKSHATNLWERGALLKLASGLLTPCVDSSGGSAEIDTDDTGTGVRLFIAVEDHLTAGSVFVAVQEILPETVIELQILGSGSTNPTSTNVAKGGQYTGYQIDNGTMHGSGIWGLDVDDTTKPILSVIDVQTNYSPWDGAAADYDYVRVKVLGAVLA